MTTTLIAYESLFGNGEAVAHAIGEGLRPYGDVASWMYGMPPPRSARPSISSWSVARTINSA
jgi:hypothetical protein